MIESLIQSELAKIEENERRTRLSSLLISPRPISLAWDYGEPGERFNCWLVGESAAENVWLVYSEHGFGPSFPWGFVFPDRDSFGMDSQWYDRLEDAAENIGLID